jgi:hypothetical protein
VINSMMTRRVTHAAYMRDKKLIQILGKPDRK